jgi:hypothetical protein
MLQLDHLTVIAPSLADGVAHVRDCLGLDMPYGRVHPDMGTHNHLLRLGADVYLEVIAVNPNVPPPPRQRWFGLDDTHYIQRAWASGSRLRGWVARTADIDAVLPEHESILGAKTRLSGGTSFYFFSVPPGGALPLGGVAPSVIDRGGRPPTVAAMADLGARLRRLIIEHPDPAEVTALYEKLRIENPPVVRKGDAFRYRAEIETPSGLKELS